MKVSTGKFKQTKLLSPKVKNSRPTDNKVKEAIMDMLYPLEKDYLMLDLFSCTGQMGIEFLSRGTKKVYFNEINRSNFKLLKQNLDKFEGIDYECFNNDFRTTLKILSTKKINFGYIYLDPPYKSDYVDKSLKLIIKYDLLNSIGLIITEMDVDVNFNHIYPQLEVIKEKKYGRKYIKFYKKI